MTWSADLIEQLEFYWSVHLWPRLARLSDDEYLWQPVGEVWTVRPDDQGRLRPDGGDPAPPTPPVTTIAWRLDHVTRGVLGTRARSLFGGSPLPDSAGADMYDERHWPEPVPTGADEALSRLRQAYELWQAGARALGDAGMQRPLGARGGPYADDSYAQLVLHINREVMAHGAEICLLRDLYRAKRNDADPLTAAALRGDADTVRTLTARSAAEGLAADAAGRGHWAVVRALAEGGASIEGALHYAAAANQGELCDLLVQRGADLQATDATYGQTPSGWAQFMGHHELAERLRPTPG